MKIFYSACLLVLLASSCPAQLSLDQKLADFNQLVSLYDKNYAPYEWKITAFGYDLLNTGPWVDRVKASKDDLEFYQICFEYVASLNDAHDSFSIYSDFSASLPIGVDIYDGKVLIESISSSLSSSKYPFQIGDELVSVDGRSVEDLIQEFSKLGSMANPTSTRRLAASKIVSRSQSVMPYAHQIGDSATIVVRRQNGNLETYQLPWTKSGTPITAEGPVSMPHSLKSRRAQAAQFSAEPDYMLPLRQLQNVRLAQQTSINLGSRTPMFNLPSGFVRRLGGASTDTFYSGTFKSGGYNIGFIRIPSFSPSSTTLAYSQFQTEIAYFKDNTDGLIVDDMHNPGGSVCYVEQLLTYLMPQPFRVLGFEIRATEYWLYSFSLNLTNARLFGSSQDTIDLYSYLLSELQTAYAANRGKTGPLPLCTTSLMRNPATDSSGKMIAYTKPIMLLTDEMSASGGDAFPATFQDAERGLIFGMRTMGAGGSVIGFDATNYSEGSTRMTVSQMNRKLPVVTSDYPTAPYVENIGVRPDIAVDYMTRDNLLNHGQSFVNAFTGAMVDLIAKSQQPQQ